MLEYPSNAYKKKEEDNTPPVEKKVEKIVTGKVKSKKKNELKKFAEVFIAEDIANVKSYIVMDVIVPAIKETITSSIDAILNGGTGRSKRNSGNSSKVSYRSYYEKENNRSKDTQSSRVSAGYSYDDIILDTRGEAEDVIMRMDELISTYGIVSVGDLYDLVGISGNYTDNKYGWTDIRSAQPVRVKDGYMLKLPRALPLN